MSDVCVFCDEHISGEAIFYGQEPLHIDCYEELAMELNEAEKVCCHKCGSPVDEDRLEFLLATNRSISCPKCCGERQKVTLMDYSHKTAGCAVVIPDDPEQIRMAFRVYHRSR